MLITTFIKSKADIDLCKEASLVEEVLIEPRVLSKLGQLDSYETIDLASYSAANNLRPILVWDIRMTESKLKLCIDYIQKLNLDSFFAIRVLDLGALHYLMEKFPSMPVQLLCERGNNNEASLHAWCDYVKAKSGRFPSRLVISPELSGDDITRYCKNLPSPVELLAAGPLEIFYSSRHLLSAFFQKDQDPSKIMSTKISSMEGQGVQHRIYESEHGTFLFHEKDQFLLAHSKFLDAAGVNTLRLDLRFTPIGMGSSVTIARYSSILEQLLNGEHPTLTWPCPWTDSFFVQGKTNSDFAFLKSSSSLIRKSEKVIAELVAFERDQFSAFKMMSAASIEGPLYLVIPTGEERAIEGLRFRDSHGNALKEAKEGQIIYSQYLPRLQEGSLICRH